MADETQLAPVDPKPTVALPMLLLIGGGLWLVWHLFGSALSSPDDFDGTDEEDKADDADQTAKVIRRTGSGTKSAAKAERDHHAGKHDFNPKRGCALCWEAARDAQAKLHKLKTRG